MPQGASHLLGVQNTNAASGAKLMPFLPPAQFRRFWEEDSTEAPDAPEKAVTRADNAESQPPQPSV
eukprot:3225062-Rhodomonas_salina.1